MHLSKGKMEIANYEGMRTEWYKDQIITLKGVMTEMVCYDKEVMTLGNQQSW